MSVAIASTERNEVATATPEPASIINMIARAASDATVSIDKMERLFAMHEAMQARAAQSAYQAAMALAQAEIGPVARDRMNAHTKSAYATLEAVDDAIRPIYTGRGFSLSFDSETTADGKLTVFCDVLHKDGHRERKSLTGALDTVGPNGSRNKTDIQGLGSSTSYLRRYLTCMIFNVTIRNEDRDGNARKPIDTAAVTDKQAEELRALITQAKADIGGFLSYYKAESLSDFPRGRFSDAMGMLRTKIAKQDREAANA
jgi:hypothetical protein